jgi:hypothetical protein
MQLAHIELEHLCISPLNMRHGKKTPDVSDRGSVQAEALVRRLLAWEEQRRSGRNE